MNFFQHQAQARKKTGMLVGLLIAAVATLIVITVGIVAVLMFQLDISNSSSNGYSTQGMTFSEHLAALAQSAVVGWIGLGVVTVVLLGCGYKSLQLRQGGSYVAEALGGRLIQPNTADAEERKVLNVVEEMAIASGNPVPPVYLMEDSSINAFAAGRNRRDAVIGVTRGCIQQLNRDELQGVMAHEFSHIHNGDMRLNMRLIAILHGILVIGLIGYYIMRTSGSRRKSGAQQALLGLALMAVGYGGTFFGNIIKAAVSRQREFLADASAVQFTRNPQGISGALKKIGGFSQGSQLSSSHAAEFSHFFFGEGIASGFFRLMATHPPLEDRIRRIDPRWKGSFEQTHFSPSSASSELNQMTSGFSAAGPAAATLYDSLIEHAGEAAPESIAHADDFLEALPQSLHDATHEPYSARAVVYGLLLDAESSVRETQLTHLKENAHPASYKVLLDILGQIDQLERSQHFPLLALCMPALKMLSEPQYNVFKANLKSLIKSDNKVSLFEWSLYRCTIKTVEALEIRGVSNLKQVRKAAEHILYFTALAGKSKDALAAYNKGLAEIGSPLSTNMNEKLNLRELDATLDQLEKLKPLEKPKLLKALISVINADGEVTVEERELFRAIADTLNCPVPPL